MNDDRHYMAQAVRLARQRLGRTGENPSVGCVIVKNGRVIGTGITGFGGRPHAETVALFMAGKEACGATVYVTLEPCAHHGHTPPCAEALIAAGVARVVIGTIDADPRVQGKGMTLLKSKSLQVENNVLLEEVTPLYRGFFQRVTARRPYVLAKMAMSLDGRIATRAGYSQWLTSPAARAFGQQLRSRVEAVVTGIGTVLADDPQLTCRLPGLERFSPMRVVLDRKGRLPTSARVVTDTTVPTWRYGAQPLADTLPSPHRDCPWDGTIPSLLESLGSAGVSRLMVEAGSGVLTAFLEANAIDEIYWFCGPVVLGGDAKPAFQSLGVNALHEAPRFILKQNIMIGSDIVLIMEKQYV